MRRNDTLLLLGIVASPTVHTLFALVVLPCLFVLAYGAVRPALSERRWVRIYGIIAVALSATSWTIQLAHVIEHG